jgi:hypothetical protein
MSVTIRTSAIALSIMMAVAAGGALAGPVQVRLSGAEEVPPVQSSGAGSGTIMVNDDKTVSGSITTSGVKATMAHIHMAPAGQNGGVAIPLNKNGEHEWVVPAGARLTDEQYKAFQAGHLYINVHSDAHKAGEIRGQLKP